MSADLERWLHELGLSQYFRAFVDADVDFSVLPDLSDSDLQSLGLSLGHRRRLQRAIAELQTPPAVIGSVADGSTPATEITAHEAERRQLTVFFCDLVGSTELSGRLDPEDLRELTRRYQDGVSGVVVRHGGYVANFLGDGIVAYFGWPRADEDDVSQAVRAGLESVAAVSELVAEGARLEARVGIASGMVVVGDLEAAGRRQEGAVAGETPNLAARLQAVAGPGEVVIGGLTRNLVGAAFVLEELGSQNLKGIPDLVPAWRVLRERQVQSRFDTREGLLTPLIGREQEMELLVERFERAVTGEGQVVLLSGEAGIGKSRLVQILHQRLREVAHTRVRLQCSPFHTASELYPVIRHLEHAAGFLEGDEPDVKLGKFEVLLRQTVEDPAECVALLSPLLSLPVSDRSALAGLEAEHRRSRTLKILVDQLLILARQKPLLLVLEDLHWVDPATLELVTNLVARIADVPILLLITHRPEFQAEWVRHPQVTVLTLNRLSRAQAAEVVRAAGGAALPEEVAALIGRRADGIPLFIEELTRSVIEAGGAFGDSDIPETLQASLLARLDRLGPEAKEVAQIAAVIGREFEIRLLAQVLSKSPEVLMPALRRLVSSQIILPTGSAQEHGYIFRHALLQDSAYQSLLLTRRRQYHRAIARALEQNFRELVEIRPELVAQHFTAAAEADTAIAYWQKAAQRAAGRYANRESVAHLERAVQLVPAIANESARSQQHLELMLPLAEAQFRASRFDDAVQTFAGTVRLARMCNSAAGLARAAVGLSEAELLMDLEVRQSASLLEEALTVLDKNDAVLRCRVISRLGQAVFYTGAFDRSRSLMREATALARQLGDPHALFDALIAAWTTTASQPVAAREFGALKQNCVDTVAAAQATNDLHMLGRAFASCIPSYLEMGDSAGFEAVYVGLCKISERDQGFTAQRYAARSAATMRAILIGEFTEAARLAGETLDSDHGIDGAVASGVYGVQMFTIRREQGRLAEVAPILKRFIDENPRDRAWRPGLALIASDLGFIEPARKAFDDLAAAGFEFPIDAKRNLILSYLAEVCVRLGDADRAEQLYELLLPYKDMALVVPSLTICCGSNQRYLGMLAACLGDWTAAEAHFTGALEFDERFRAWPWLSHTKHEYAAALLSRGRASDRSRVETLLGEAAASAERIGMPALQQRIREMQR
jgi:predicted ATPase/class 3 adenylate cyclase